MDDQQHSSSGNRPRLRGNHAASSNSSCSRTSPPSNQRHQRDFLPEQLEVNGMNDAGSSDNSMSELSATVQGSHNRKRSGVMSLEDIDDTGQQNSLETDNGDEMNFDYSEDGANGLAACSADVQQNEGLNHSNGHNPFELCSESKEPCVDEDSEMLLCDEVVSNRDAAVRGRHDQFHADHYAMYFDDVNDAEDGFGNDGLALETEVTDDEDGTGAANRSIDLVKRPMEDEEDAVEEGVLCGIDDKQRVLPVTTAGVSSGAAYLSESSAAVSCGRGKNVKNESAYAPPPMVLPRDRTAVASSSVHQLQQQQAGRSGPYQYYLSSKAATIQSPGYYHGMNSGGSGSAGPLAQVAPGAGFRFSANNGSNFGFGSGFSPAGAAYHSFSGARRRYLPGEEGAGPSGVSGGGASGSAPIGGHEMPPLNVVSMARGAAVGSPNNPLHNWQATKQTLKDRFSFMFNNEILADVHFIVGRGDQRQRIPAHKFVLAVGSAVFDAMFNGAMAASEQNDIDLPDVEPQAFLALLKFLYSDDVQIGPESVMTTLYTAKKYAVPALENACVDFLKRNLSPDNAFMLLTQARLFDEPQLAALCLEMIDKHSQEAINAEGFTDIDLDTLCAVLERDTLRIREVCLYAAVVRWSTEECHRQQLPVTPENQRQVLGRALQLIRFPLMSVEEFAQSAAQSGILSDREVVNLFLYFTVNPKPQVGFLDVPRCCVTGKEQVVNRFQRIEGRWGYSGTPDRIKFTVDRRIFVVGFGLFGSIHGPTEYSVNIQIIHCGSGKIIGSNDTTFQCDGSLSTFRVMFKEPVEIGPCITYIASATLKGPDSHYGTKGLRRIVHQSPGSGCVTFQFTYAAGNNNGTSVEDGQIPEIIFYTKLSS